MKLYRPLLFLTVPAVFSVCVSFAQQYPYQNPLLPVEQRVTDLLSRMTDLEKIRQLDMYRGWSVAAMGEAHEATSFDLDSVKKVFQKGSIGSIHDYYPVSAALANQVQRYAVEHTRLGIPVMFIEEGLHGYSGKGSTSFPVPLALAASWDTALVYRVGRAVATESRAHGTNMILGPLLGVARDPRWGRMEETFGEDTHLVTEIGLAMVRGLGGGDVSRQDAVVSEPKHFAAHPAPEAGSNTGPVSMGEREIRTVYLPSFKKAVQQGGALGVMAAYHEIDGIPCVDNHWLLTDLLRKDWGFKGMVVSDLGAIRMSMQTHRTAENRADALAQSFNAGMNMQFYDFDHHDFENSMDSAVQHGLISAARLDSATGDVLRVKFLLGLFDRPYTDTGLIARVVHSDDHQRLALEAAQQAAVLLKNEQGTLPIQLEAGGHKKIALIGPLAVSHYLGGYSNAEDTAISLYTGLQQLATHYKGLEVRYAPGLLTATESHHPTQVQEAAAIRQAQELALGSDVVVLCLGEDPDEVGEGKDRADLSLSLRQLRLLEAIEKTGRPLVVVLYNGRPLCLEPVAKGADAVIEGWFGGEKSGLAMARLLLGEINPSGKLPVTFPRSVGQIPFYYAHKPSSFHRYVDQQDQPLYVFGHGLSYTRFQYSDLYLSSTRLGTGDTLEVGFTVTNVGSMAGAEVAQLYIRDEVASVTTPVKALKGFSRVFLAPGASTTVRMRLPVQEALGLWNAQMHYVVEPGNFELTVGASSADIRLQTKFEVLP